LSLFTGHLARGQHGDLEQHKQSALDPAQLAGNRHE